MAMAMPQTNYRGGGGPSGLADVLDVLLDKGLVIDAFVRVSLVGIELLTIDARVVVASVDTYLRFAEAVNRLDLNAVGQQVALPDLVERGAESKSKGAIEGVKDKLGLGSGGDEDGESGSDRGDDADESDREAGSSEDKDGGLTGAIGKVAAKVRDRGRYSES